MSGRSWFWPSVAILGLGLIVGLSLGNDYGVSWDEVRNADVGADALRLLSGSRDYFSDPALADHGPAYFMLFSAGSRVVTRLLPSWTEADGRHLVNFSVFLVGVLCFYLLARRLVRTPYDWMVTALFATQPLLFGYGFVSQKDVPFLTAFMATLVLGLSAFDRWRSSPSAVAPAAPSRASLEGLVDDWRALRLRRRVLLGTAGILLVVLILDLVVFRTLHRLGQSLVEAAYAGAAPGPVQALFGRFAVDAYKTPISAYLDKFDALYVNLGLAAAVLAGLAVGWLYSTSLPSLKSRLRDPSGMAKSPTWLISAALLGITISIRQVGGYVGLLVAFEALRLGRWRAVVPLVLYGMIAALTTLVTWPYLWADPIHRILESLRLAAVFSRHSTLFQGQRFASGELPWDFFPTLTALQLTETAGLLILAGLLLIVIRALQRQPQKPLVGILALWVGGPLALLVLFKMAGYEFRQFLFMVPPLVLIGGIALEAIGDRLRHGWALAALFAIVLLPGLVGIVRLHPYEYIYFNGFAGGVSGADGLYQLDRECLSYREAIEDVNRLAPRGAVVIVPQQTNQVAPYARPDLILRDISGGLAEADFVLSCTWRDENDWPTTGFMLVDEIRRGSAVLTEVWQREAGG